jgi:hypothetical protein
MNTKRMQKTIPLFLMSFLFLTAGTLLAQDKLKKMPGYAHYKKMAPQLYSSIKRMPSAIKWAANGTSFTYVENGKPIPTILKKEWQRKPKRFQS